MKSCWIVQGILAIALSAIATLRTDFSLEKVSAPLLASNGKIISTEIEEALSQNYRFLGKGRQSFVFCSEDGKTVLKFFNKSYFEIPWYAFFVGREKEREKREVRRNFYLKSYRLAEQFLREETGIFYLHLGKTEGLARLCLVDRASRHFTIDLNQMPFVLQRRANPFYPALEQVILESGMEGLEKAIDSYLKIIAKRIACGISDGDHDVEHNFGLLDGKPLHIDPGRFSLGGLLSKEKEWWSATHRFRDWLEERHPEVIPFFEHSLQTKK